MSIDSIFDRINKELSMPVKPVAEDTTSASIAYLPVQFGEVGRAIHREFSPSKESGIQVGVGVSDIGNGKKKLTLSKSMQLTVDSDEDLEHLNKNLFGGTLKHGGIASMKIEKFNLKEAKEDDVAKRLDELHKAMQTFYFENAEIKKARDAVRNFQLEFTDIKNLEISSLLSYNDGIENFYDVVKKYYNSDIGNIELLTKATKDKTPLNAFDGIADYEYLFGDKVQGSYKNEAVILETIVRFDGTPTEKLYIDNDNIIDVLKKTSGVIVINNSVSPVAKHFNDGLFKQLKKIIEDIHNDKD